MHLCAAADSSNFTAATLYFSFKEGRAAIENNFDISPYSSIAWLLLQICWVFSSAVPSTALCRNAVNAKHWLHV